MVSWSVSSLQKMEDELTQLELPTKALGATLLGFLNQLVREMKGRKEELGLNEAKRKTLRLLPTVPRRKLR
jgi:hypothetical protein